MYKLLETIHEQVHGGNDSANFKLLFNMITWHNGNFREHMTRRICWVNSVQLLQLEEPEPNSVSSKFPLWDKLHRAMLKYVKRCYWLLPPSSKEEVLERNVLASLKEVLLISTRRFATRSLRFMDAYHKGLNGRQAAWAAKKYRGHRVIPEVILQDLIPVDVNWYHDLIITLHLNMIYSLDFWFISM